MALNSCRKVWAAALVAVVVAPGTVLGQARIDWGNVATLKAGRPIEVHLRQDRRRVEGEYATHDDTSLTVRSSGVLQRIERDNIRRVVARRDVSRRKHVVIGAIAGAGAGVASVAGQDDWSALGRIMWAAIGAGAGALIGFIASLGSDAEVIYVGK